MITCAYTSLSSISISTAALCGLNSSAFLIMFWKPSNSHFSSPSISLSVSFASNVISFHSAFISKFWMAFSNMAFRDTLSFTSSTTPASSLESLSKVTTSHFMPASCLLISCMNLFRTSVGISSSSKILSASTTTEVSGVLS